MKCNLSEYCFSVLTPYFKEDVLYSDEELNKENEDGISILFYLTKIYPGEYFYMLTYISVPLVYVPSFTNWNWCTVDEWANFHERLKSEDIEEDKEELMRQWASYRGQTLYRTGLDCNERYFHSYISVSIPILMLFFNFLFLLVRGMMYYWQALILQCFIESAGDNGYFSICTLFKLKFWDMH